MPEAAAKVPCTALTALCTALVTAHSNDLPKFYVPPNYDVNFLSSNDQRSRLNLVYVSCYTMNVSTGVYLPHKVA